MDDTCYTRVSAFLEAWLIGSDSGRGAMSRGTIEPERISEVVSDVVESGSGYLDVQFEVPSGGAFRVMDVIIAEAPRFSDGNGPPASDAKRQIADLH